MRASLFRFGLPSFALAAVLCGLIAPATAQTVPATVDPGRVRSDIERRPVTTGVPETEITTSPLAKAPAGAASISFVLRDLRIEGAHDIAPADLQKIYRGDLNRKISLQRVYEIANRITLLYRERGYILSRAVVPPQEIGKNGIVRIQVVEGFVTRYDIRGNVPPHMKDKIAAYARQLVGRGTVSASNLERYLLLMNDLPGIRVRSVLSPSASTPGGADLTLIVEQRKAEFLAGLDNFGNSYLGPLRLSGSAQINSPFNEAGQLSLNTLQAPDHHEVQYYSAGYQYFIGSEGTRAGVSASYTKTQPSLPVALGGALDPEGEATSYAASIVHPFVRTRAVNVNAGLSFEVDKNQTNYATGLSALETDDDLRVLRANSDMTYLDGLRGFNTGRLTLSQGLDVFGASQSGDSNLSRPAGKPDFTKLNAEYTRLQNVRGPVNAFIGVIGQYANDPLLSAEEMGLGGPEYGRGYDLSEITGDRGLAGKIELSYRENVNYKYTSALEPYVFYDLGAVWNEDPGAGVSSRASLASTGLGLRATLTNSLRFDTFIAKPLTRDVPSRGDDGDELRWKFSITSNF